MENDLPQQTQSQPIQQQPPAPSKRRPRLIASLLSVLVVAVLIVLSLLLFHASNTTTKSKHGASTATVQITSQGFEPVTLKVRVGTKVTWNNTDSTLHQIASNPYPANNGLAGLASPGLEPGKSYSYTFKQAGTFGYHDQQNPTHVLGVINVAE